MLLADPDDKSPWDTAVVIGQEGTGAARKPNADGNKYTKLVAFVPDTELNRRRLQCAPQVIVINSCCYSVGPRRPFSNHRLVRDSITRARLS